ncbi:calcium-binding protein [Streptomyces sp. XD-27]|uniref:calcium-binding protein n=1 Tax=Streptomyces sp. XD-27 TaxID=3062779 RepID=UPI0026F433DD|nr:calcium-binding protein [Streptomyces sp. XD-27]WKX73290.1 calcium-binding protein [Streptomyces sp. XD-27]
MGLALVLALPGVAWAAPGDLDTGFGAGGKVLTDMGGGEEAHGMAVQPDGKIVAVGIGASGDFGLARYTSDGSLDTGFSGDGMVTTDFGGDDVANGVALQSDGKIVVVGRSEDVVQGGCCWFTVARYTSDGSLDTAFSGDGMVTTDFGSDGAADGSAVAVQSDGRIVAVGQSGGEFAVARYTSDGSLDTAFSGDGTVTTAFDGGGLALDMALQPDGKIVAVGYAGGTAFDFALARYTSDGSLDTGFSGDGKVTTDFGGTEFGEGVAVQSDGRIVAVGASGGDFAVARYTGDGSLDTGFSGDGKVTTDFDGRFDHAHDVAVQSDGRIIAAGNSATADVHEFALARYNTTGSLDTGFSGDGKVTTDFGGTDQASAVALQSDDKIVAAGTGGPGYDFALARYEGGSAPPPPGVDVSVAKSGPAAVSIGDRVSYTVTVTNSSETASATDVALADALTGAGVTLMSATPSQGTCTTTSTGADCTLGSLAPGAAATVTVVAEPRSTGSLSDTATVDATETDPVPGNNTATATTTVNNARGCTTIGTSGADNLVGTSGNDVICALSGDDVVSAVGGNDTVHAGYGNDRADGGIGNDTLNAGPGNDTLTGYSGADALDTVDTVSGNDTANGGAGTDTCTTDPGDIRTSCS